MKIIKIDRTSIKRNPNAGSTRTYLQGLKDTSFKIKSGKIPKWLLKDPFYPTDQRIENNIVIELEGKINGPITDKMIEKFKTVKGLSINILCEPIIIDHFPEPDYLFEYEKTKLKCKHCKNKVDVDAIETDWIMDEYEVEICPICQQENTFPKYKYEKIENAIKGK